MHMFVENNWAIGNLIRKLRKEQGLTLSQLCNGLCSVATMNRIETEDSVENLLLIIMILQRLGVNPDRFELYSSKTQFEQLQQRVLIKVYVRDRNFKEATRMLYEYKMKWNDIIINDKLQNQFIKGVHGYLEIQFGNLEKGILKLEESIQISVPEWKRVGIISLILSEEELILLSLLADSYEIAGKISDAFSLRIKIIEYIKQSRILKDLKPQLFNEVICKTVPSLIKQGEANIALDLCNQALHVLMETKRMYCWPELLQLKAECLEEISLIEVDKSEELMDIYKKSLYIHKLFQNYECITKIKAHLKEKYGWEFIL